MSLEGEEMRAQNQAAAKTNYCVTTATDRKTGHTATGIFTWTGASWRTASIQDLVKPLPASADLAKEYRAFTKSLRETARG
jgi:hypothetical protein